VPQNKVSGVKVSRGEFCNEISPLAAILLSNDIRRGANNIMLLPPCNKVLVGDMSGVTTTCISTDGDFSEGETLLCDIGCGCALLLRASYVKFGLI